MDDLIKLVRTFRLTGGLAERLRLVEEIFHLIEPDLRLFVFSAIRPPAANDVFQHVLIAITTALPKFEGDTRAQFWAWCYRITRHKLGDHYVTDHFKVHHLGSNQSAPPLRRFFL